MVSPQTLSEADRRRVADWAGAAGYAALAVGLADPDHQPEVIARELRWQLDHMSAEVRAALQTLPPVGEDRSGPLGPGLLASGQLGSIIRELQARIVKGSLDRVSRKEL